jgi:hypothetical protein
VAKKSGGYKARQCGISKSVLLCRDHRKTEKSRTNQYTRPEGSAAFFYNLFFGAQQIYHLTHHHSLPAGDFHDLKETSHAEIDYREK